MPTPAKIALIDRLGHTGVGRIEAVSFVRADAIPQMADADEVWAGVARVPTVRYSALAPNLRGARRALDAGFTEVEVVVSASDTHNRKNVNRSTEQSLDEIAVVIDEAHQRGATCQVIVSTAWGCPYEGDVPVDRVLSGGGPRRGRRGRLGLVRRHDRDGHPAAGAGPGRRVPVALTRTRR